MTTVVSLRKDGWIGTEKLRGTAPVWENCPARGFCPDVPQGCERCVKESLIETEATINGLSEM